MTYRFGPFTFDGFKLRRDGVVVEDLEEQQLEVLRMLVEWAESHPGAYLDKAEMIKRLWADPERPVRLTVDNPAHSLSVAVGKLRVRLGERPDGEPYINKGRYRLNEKVERVEDADGPRAGGEDPEAAGEWVGADPQKSPYVGPQPFPPERAADFFGREDEVRELVRLLSDPRAHVVALYSPSGAGKTSLINTALRYTLLESGHQILPIARVGVPAEEPGAAPSQNHYTFAAIASMERENADILQQQGPLTWAGYLSLKGTGAGSVLVIDQLEEVVTTDKSGSPRQKEEFFVELGEAVARDPSLRVLLAFREEYLVQLQRLAGELSQTWRHYPLTPLRRKDCELAIRGPAGKRGVSFDHDVLNQLVAKLTTVRYLDESGALCEEPGDFVEPLQLQLICDTLWKSLPAGWRRISWGELRHASRREGSPEPALGMEQTISSFVQSVLYNFCEQATRDASSAWRGGEGPAFPKELTILGCRQFVSERGMRTQVRRGEGWTGDLPNAVADGLAAWQFLRVEQRHGDQWYELAHDTLIRPVVERAEGIDDDALRATFASVVREVAADPRAGQEGVNEAAIAQESCLVFVARDGSPQQASLESVSVRLPPWVVEALADRGVLRRVRLQGQPGYELTHPRMALALHREQFVALDRLYSARKLLASHLDLCLAADASPSVWYQESDNILKELEELVGVPKLSDMEARFALCASLATGYHLKGFVAQVGNQFRAVAEDALHEAVRYEHDPNVRRHAALALGLFPFEGREEILFNLALNDPEDSVKQTAARMMAGLESAEHLERLFGLLNEPEWRARALRTLAWIHDAAPADGGLWFEERRKDLPAVSRLRLRAKLTGVRWRGAKKRILLALLIGLISTILVTAPPRALLAAFGLTVTQNEPMGLFEGLFHGAAGALLWSLFIGGSLLGWWFVGERRRPWQGGASPLVGALGGLVGGVVNSLALITVFGPTTLAKMGWIESARSSQLETLTATGLALAMPLYGMLVGLGVGEAARWILPWWRESAAEHAGMRQALRSIANETLLHSWLVLVPLLAAAVAFRAFLGVMPRQLPGYGQKLFGEALSLYFGGVGLLIGLFLGLHFLRKGLHIPGDEELS